MSSAASTTTTPAGVPADVLPRLIEEGHTSKAWFGTDLVTAVGEIDADTASWRPAPGRHNIGEIALHHAFWVREVRGRLTGARLEPFVADGEDWFPWPAGSLTWTDVQRTLADQVQRLEEAVAGINAGRLASPLSAEERFDQVLGIAGHAAYHAGQVQLLRRLAPGSHAQ